MRKSGALVCFVRFLSFELYPWNKSGRWTALRHIQCRGEGTGKKVWPRFLDWRKREKEEALSEEEEWATEENRTVPDISRCCRSFFESDFTWFLLLSQKWTWVAPAKLLTAGKRQSVSFENSDIFLVIEVCDGTRTKEESLGFSGCYFFNF